MPLLVSEICGNSLQDMCSVDDLSQAVITDAKYEGYLAKQERLVSSFKALENRKLPPDLEYHRIEHLRVEAKEKLSIFKPSTLAQACRISGITPADITVLQVYLKKMHKKQDEKA
jgi:tRNA uridine 5-carboxymethylaminomethyl modification enzyme